MRGELKYRKDVILILWTTKGGRSNSDWSWLKGSFNLMVLDFILKILLLYLNCMKIPTSSTAYVWIWVISCRIQLVKQFHIQFCFLELEENQANEELQMLLKPMHAGLLDLSLPSSTYVTFFFKSGWKKRDCILYSVFWWHWKLI